MYMRPYHLKTLIKMCALSILLMSGKAGALSTDKEQPIEIEADSAELDDKKRVTIYEGAVVVTQGSIRMTGDRMTVYYTKNNELDTVILTGKPATYRQMPDKGDVYDESEALRMEFYKSKNLIILINKAKVKQNDMSFGGDRIEYDTEHSKIRARGLVTIGGKPSDDGEATPPEKGRVKIIIKPPGKKEQD